MRKTRDRIIYAFLELLHEYPYNRITVRMITEKCGMHRNTFYYYFEDLPVLLEFIVKDGISRIIRSRFEFESPLDCVRPIILYAERYKTKIENVYSSLSMARIVETVEDSADFIVNRCIKTVAGDLVSVMDPADFAALRGYYVSLVTGALLEWLRHGMTADLLEYAERMHHMTKRFGGNPFFAGRAELEALSRARAEAEAAKQLHEQQEPEEPQEQTETPTTLENTTDAV